MNPVELEIYRNVYASIAEEMGATLMRCAFSPNISERRDFSCAVFDAGAEMIEQAAHIPVHLGSAPLSAQAALAFSGPHWPPGRHVILNDPFAGGTHLPDITVVSPVHSEDGELLFLVANRAHHADVGGVTPGSLPLSRSIDEEGIRIQPSWLTDDVVELVCAASRTPMERRADLRAQLAANARGIARLREWSLKRGFREAGAELQDYSERLMCQALSALPDGTWHAADVMDGDGLQAVDVGLVVRVTIAGGRAEIDFSGTAGQVGGPINVPRAVTVSAVLYAFCCLAPRGLSANAGAMRCLTITTEPGSLVDAEYPAAVAVGNTETSQRIADVVFAALAQADGRVPAASCGSMNNIVIGGTDPRTGREFAYYETLAGGSGAGPQGQGASAIHTHMTNTLNTPIEALEHAYPFRVTRYAVRRGSGGEGAHRGGDGVIREYEFDSPAVVTVMSERRRHAPSGRLGGDPAMTGRNTRVDATGESLLPAKVTADFAAGDKLIVATPGGGGFGAPLRGVEPPA